MSAWIAVGDVRGGKYDGRQVEVMYNKLLDLSDKFRDEMGEISDNVSLSTALETAWHDLPSRTGTPAVPLTHKDTNFHPFVPDWKRRIAIAPALMSSDGHKLIARQSAFSDMHHMADVYEP